MCRLVTLLTLASAVSRSVAFEEPDCPLQNDVDFAESSDFDPNLPLTFGGGIVIEMTVTTPSSSSKNARVFSFSNYGRDVVQMSTASSGYLFFGTSRGSGSVSGISASSTHNGETFTVRAVILPGSTADSTTGQCFLYLNGTLSSSGYCALPTFVERRANFIGYDLSDNPTFEGTVSNFTLKACSVTPSVPTPLPSPQCLLQNDVDFAESSDFDPNLPLTFGGGIVIEMTLTTPSTYSYKARVFSFSNYGNDTVRMSVTSGGAIFFGVSRGSGSVSGITSRSGYNGVTITLSAGILPGSTADSTTGECFLYINNVLEAYSSSCPLPTFVERRANFIGHDLTDYLNFKGTVANFTLKACNVTPSVPTPLPSPQCLLQNDVDFAESSDFDPNLPLTFGGGIVIEMTLTTPSTSSYGSRVFSFSNYGSDIVRMNVTSVGAIFFGVSRGSGSVSGITSRYGYNDVTISVRAVILPGSTADSTTGQCLLYINNVLQAYSSSFPLPMRVVRKSNFIANDTDSSIPTFQGTVADFSMRSCNGSVDTSAPATAVPFTSLPNTLAPDTAAPPPRTAHPGPPGDSAAPMVPTAVPTVVPTPLRTSAPTEPSNATAFDETDAPTTAAPEKDDSGTPWWVWVMLGLGTLLVLVVGGLLLCFCHRGNGTSPPTVDSHHIQAETDHGASELLYHGVDDEPEVAC